MGRKKLHTDAQKTEMRREYDRNRPRIHTLRKAIEEIAKIPTPVTTKTGRQAFAVIYSQNYQQAVQFLVNHFNDGSLAILNGKTAKHKPYEYTGADNYRSYRRQAERFMMFSQEGDYGKNDNSSKQVYGGREREDRDLLSDSRDEQESDSPRTCDEGTDGEQAE